MTFSGFEMMVVLAAVALLLFWRLDGRVRIALGVAVAVMLAGILLSDTRGVWLAVAIAGCYIVAMWRAKLLLAVPGLLLAGFFLAPHSVQERVRSIYHPHGTMDSNEHRRVTAIVGWQMIKAHPLLGIGPDEVSKQFQSYVPQWVPRRLPEGFYGHLHSIYIHYAAERGIPTTLALMWILFASLFKFVRGARLMPDQPRRAILYGVSAVIIGTAVEGLFETNLGDSEPLALSLSMLACGYFALLLPSQEPEHA